MSTEENKALIRRFVEEIVNKGNIALIDELVAANYIDHSSPPGAPSGIEGSKQFTNLFRMAFPDIHITLDDLIAEGDKVVSRFTMRGTNKGEFLGIPPTGKQVTITGIHIDRFAGGKLVEHWGQQDTLGLMQQLGVIPAMG